MQIPSVIERLRSSLWFVPSLIAAASVGLAFGAVAIDRRFDTDAAGMGWIYSGGVDGARQVLSVISSSMMTVAGVAFSVTTVALSFASQQLGPRLLRNFMRDRGNQIVLGTFIGTFLYCLLVLRTIRGEEGPDFVPHIAVTVALVLAILSVGVLIYFIHHVAQSLQADYVIALVAADFDRTMKHIYPSGIGREPVDARLNFDEIDRELEAKHCDIAAAQSSGYIDAVDGEKLLRIAKSRDLLIRLIVKPGDYLFDGVAIARIYPAGAADERIFRRINSAFILERSRGAQDDIEFAVNQLVEVAARAMSPGINDPFTAIAAVDRLGTAILHLMRVEQPSPLRFDDEGRLRVIAPRPDFAGVVDSAFHQVRQYGLRMPAVTIRLLEVIAMLVEQARTDEQRTVLERHAEMVRRNQLREAEEPNDRVDVEERFERVAEAEADAEAEAEAERK